MRRGVVLAIAFASIVVPVHAASAVRHKPAKVVYVVTGDGTASVNLTNATGGTDQHAVVTLPWKMTLDTVPPDGFVFVSAQQQGTGNVACKITYGSRTVQKASSHGAHVFVTCSGSVKVRPTA